MHIKVRTAGKEDLESINNLLNELQKCDFEVRKEKFNNALESGCSSYLIATTPDSIIGYLNIWHLPDIVDGGAAGIMVDIYVSDKNRDMGVGQLLLEAAFELGEKKGVNKYYAWMASTNKPAISLLKRHGFKNESLMYEKKIS